MSLTLGRSRIWLASSSSSSSDREYRRISSGTFGSEQCRLSTYSIWRLQPLKIGMHLNIVVRAIHCPDLYRVAIFFCLFFFSKTTQSIFEVVCFHFLSSQRPNIRDPVVGGLLVVVVFVKTIIRTFASSTLHIYFPPRTQYVCMYSYAYVKNRILLVTLLSPPKWLFLPLHLEVSSSLGAGLSLSQPRADGLREKSNRTKRNLSSSVVSHGLLQTRGKTFAKINKIRVTLTFTSSTAVGKCHHNCRAVLLDSHWQNRLQLLLLLKQTGKENRCQKPAHHSTLHRNRRGAPSLGFNIVYSIFSASIELVQVVRQKGKSENRENHNRNKKLTGKIQRTHQHNLHSFLC